MRTLVRLLLVALVATALASAASAGSRSVARPLLVLPPAIGVYHAASPDFCPSEDCVSPAKVEAFQALAGKHVVWAAFSDNWFNGIRFPAQEALAIWQQDYVVPLIRIMPRSDWRSCPHDQLYSLEKIVSGVYDLDLEQYARDVRDTNIPVMIDFAPEANGDWFPWSAACHGGHSGAKLYARTFRHLVDLFRGQGVRNVTWVLQLNGGSAPDAPWNRAASYYPGDKYVDWVGVSDYGEGYAGAWPRSLHDALVGPYQDMVKAAPNKPFALFETGTVEDPQHLPKAAWIKAAYASILAGDYPHLKAVAWWQSDFLDRDGRKSVLRIDSSAQSLAAYRAAVSSPLMVGKVRLAERP